MFAFPQYILHFHGKCDLKIEERSDYSHAAPFIWLVSVRLSHPRISIGVQIELTNEESRI